MTYTINENCTIEFNPLSRDFVKRLTATYSEMEAIYKSEDFNIIVHNKVFRAKIDELFGEHISDQLFGDHNVFLTSGGTPLWFNFMNAIIQEVERQLFAIECFGKQKGKRKKSGRRK